MHHLSFRIDDTRYAIPANAIVEIVRAVAIMPLPGAPAVVSGIIDYRGTTTPVFDVARRFRHESRPVRAGHHMIVADAGPRRVVLHVDRVDDLLSPDQVAQDGVPVVVAPNVPIAGVARTPDGLVVIQDLTRFLSDAEAAQLSTALEATSG